MARAQIAKHGRDHRVGGHDPIPGLSTYVPPVTTDTLTEHTAIAQSTPHTCSFSGGGVLLDVSTPTLPSVIVSGIYAFMVSFEWDIAMIGNMTADLTLNASGSGVPQAEWTNAYGTSIAPSFHLAATWYMAAGDDLRVTTTYNNTSTAVSSTPFINLYVQRIT